ncbi:MAG: type II toxin-antitoxin system VapC family toxin [Spirochaetales bacterium]|nr:type II toxin-antitoxin system VapC family toxin [Spirochaetales bacterium]
MRKVLIDTNVYTHFKRNNPAVTETFRHIDFIGIEVTVLAELLSGFKMGSREKKNREELEEFANSPRVHLITHDETTAEFYAAIFAGLKQKGRPVPTNDIWIAATAMQNGLALFTMDNHFSEIPGLILKTAGDY